MVDKIRTTSIHGSRPMKCSLAFQFVVIAVVCGCGNSIAEAAETSPSKTPAYADMIERGVKGFGVYCCDLSGFDGTKNPVEEAKNIARLGANFVVYYSCAHGNAARQQSDLISLDAFAKAGIGAIVCPFGHTNTGANWATYAAVYKDVPNLIGWYIFDEPADDATIAVQDATIAAVKAVKNLPCYTSENAYGGLFTPLSKNYDYIIQDGYEQLTPGWPGSWTEANALSASTATYLIGARDPRKILIGLGAYADFGASIESETALLNAWRQRLDANANHTAVFFCYNPTPKWVGSSPLTTISTNGSLWNYVSKFIGSYNPPSTTPIIRIAGPKQDNTGFPPGGGDVGYTDAERISNMKAILDHPKTTGTVKNVGYDGTVATYGFYLDFGQIGVIDFGRNVKKATIIYRFKDQYGPTTNTITIHTALRGDFSVLNQIASIAPVNSALEAYSYNVNGKYLIIRNDSTATHNKYMFFSEFCVIAN